jgi:hypothetical protein
MSDVLLVSLGTTRGLRVADSLLMAMLQEAGSSAQAISVKIGLTDALRRGYPVNDLVEAVAARRALRRALATRARPRALMFSTTTAAMLAGSDGLPYAVRLDSPAALNRQGARNAAVRALERRSLARARVIIPLGAAGAAALPAGSARAEVVPVPIEPSGDIQGSRDLDLAVAYVPDPKAKGLDVLCAAWARAARGARRLDIFGIERDVASAFLARRRLAEPPGVRFRGLVSSQEFRQALRGARCLVSGARWEDFGQAPLEALRDGALLVTTPAEGPYEALAIARGLDAGLVAGSLAPASLAAAINAAYAREDGARAAYQARAAVALEPYRRQAAVAVLQDRVLPALLERL